jgi:hypothetical protein
MEQKHEDFASSLPESIKIDDLFKIILKCGESAALLESHYELLQRSTLLSSPDAAEVGLALTRLVTMKRDIARSADFAFLLSILSSCLHLHDHSAFSPMQLAKALTSLKHLSPTLPYVQLFLQALAPKIAHISSLSSSSHTAASPKLVSSLLHIARRCSASDRNDYPWVADQIVQLTLDMCAPSLDYVSYRRHSSLSSCSPNDMPMKSTEMSQLLFNLQALGPTHSHSHPQTTLLLDNVTSWVVTSPTHLRPHEWSRALCGLNKMNSDSTEVTNLLFAIADKMDCVCDPQTDDTSPSSSPCLFSPRHLSRAMFGLRFMDSKHPAVMLIVRNITATIQVSQSDRPNRASNI